VPEASPQSADARAADAWRAAACLAIDPHGLGGAVLRGDAGEQCERWLDALRALLPSDEQLRRVPAHIDDERLMGGTDLPASLRLGRAIHARGVLEELSAGFLLLPMAERALPARLSHIGQLLDGRPGFGVIALDGGRSDEERCAPSLLERLGVHLDLRASRLEAGANDWPTRQDIISARARLGAISIAVEMTRTLCATASACGVDSLRAPLIAGRLACAHAALRGDSAPNTSDLELAARLVLAPRATRLPAPPPQQAEQQQPPQPQQQQEPQQEPPPQKDGSTDGERRDTEVSTLEDRVLQAARAALPEGLLASALADAANRRRSAQSAGRVGALQSGRARGRPAGVRAGHPRDGLRLNLIETLRAAVPWQGLRRRDAATDAHPRMLVRSQDFRVTWRRQRAQSVTVFALDASGSSALHRLSEAKGAIELLLAQCYVRRDEVAVVVFRGRAAELALPPTRSLLCVKRSLAGLPGGGTTPLASGIDAARLIAERVGRQGRTPSIVLLTDGHANVARDGSSGRARAQQDATNAAKALGQMGWRTLLIDTAPRPQALARALADRLRARYLPLPNADARSLAQAVSHGR
jgi:magnesium chelatase subunit D